jgi:hypothetical protein
MPLAECHAETLEIFRCVCIHDLIRLSMMDFQSFEGRGKKIEFLSVNRLLTTCGGVWNACARRGSLWRARAS